ncbi:hypothetical protein P3X46_005635 [Hevea brasiliensis]|uniref:eRF1/Pelota-like N-terminal domain-containing protein n=1 Tax=Hevea brasiliensis TaxID=3981 RepID=A0ABQ9N0K6_HEVBR|nr:hypothetical protein P3X46_005635 [Hevea brasiliensis]
MKITRRNIVLDGPGSIKIIPADSDDLWLIYNLISPGDMVMAVTVRKVLRELASGGRDAERVKLRLEIKVVAIDCDKVGSALRICGKNILENEYVKLSAIGAFHTLELELHRPSVLRKTLKKFFERVVQDQFHCLLLLEAERRQHSLREVPDAPNFMNLIKDTKAAQEDFFNMLSNDRGCYGPKHVEVAHERMAVRTLLMTDDLFRNADIPTRQKYVNLVSLVKDSAGAGHIFLSMHISGEQLAQLTGIAVILRFPLPDLDDIEM